MTCCRNCKVELDLTMNFCPLCGEPVSARESDQKDHMEFRRSEQEKKIISQYKELTNKQRRKLFWELSAIIIVSGVIVSVIINLVMNRGITWSKYPAVIGAALFLDITFLAFWQHRVYLLLTGSFISTSALLMVLESFNKDMSWSLSLGVPLLLAAFLITFGLISLIRFSSQRGLNLIAYTLLAIGLLTMCIEGIITLNTINRLTFQWSLIVLACILPVTGILLFIHYRLKKVTDLRRFFHI
jgi:hypothetical protein